MSVPHVLKDRRILALIIGLIGILCLSIAAIIYRNQPKPPAPVVVSLPPAPAQMSKSSIPAPAIQSEPTQANQSVGVEECLQATTQGPREILGTDMVEWIVSFPAKTTRCVHTGVKLLPYTPIIFYVVANPTINVGYRYAWGVIENGMVKPDQTLIKGTCKELYGSGYCNLGPSPHSEARTQLITLSPYLSTDPEFSSIGGILVAKIINVDPLQITDGDNVTMTIQTRALPSQTRE